MKTVKENLIGRIMMEYVRNQTAMGCFIDNLDRFDQGAVIKPNWIRSIT